MIDLVQKYYPNKTILNCLDKPFDKVEKYAIDLAKKMNEKLILIANNPMSPKLNILLHGCINKYIIYYKDEYLTFDISEIEDVLKNSLRMMIKRIDDNEIRDCLICYETKTHYSICFKCGSLTCKDCKTKSIKIDENNNLSVTCSMCRHHELVFFSTA